MPSLRSLVHKFLKDMPIGSCEKFAEWAFGEDYNEYEKAMDFMDAWNKIHGLQMKLSPDGQMTVDIENMVEMWKNEIN